MKLSIAPTRATQFISGILIAWSVLLLTACGGGALPSSQRVPLISAELTSFPTGSIPAGFNSSASVAVRDGLYGAAISDATVSMNGVSLPYQVSSKQSVGNYGDYEGNVIVVPGGVVTLSVTVDGKTYVVSVIQHATYPAISTPAFSTTWASNANNTVTWSGGAPSANESYLVGVLDAAYPNVHWSYNWPLDQAVPAGTTTYTIPPYSIAGGNRYVLAGIRTTVAVPNAVFGSSFTIGGFNYVPITVTGMPVTSRMSGDATTPALNGVAWSGTQFVVVGSGGTIFTSPDGISWTLRGSSPLFYSGVNLNDVIWSGTQFVAVAGDTTGSISTSPDGIAWTLRNPVPTLPLFGIAWSGGQFVAVGTNTILSSPDGITWTTRTPATGYYSLNSVIWSGTQFVAVGMGGAILSSPDGITWTTRISSTTSTLNDITWSGSQFVAAGGDNTTYSATILTSPDGVTWTLQPSPTSYFTNDFLNRVIWTGTQFVATGFSGVIFTSPDGVTWTQQASGVTNPLYGIAWSGTQLVMTGMYDTVLTSP